MGNYNLFADEYARKTAQLETDSRNNYYSLLPSNLEGKILLDVGCGSGQDAEYYTQQRAKVYGLDISEKEIELANIKNIGEFRVGDMKKLPYESNTFDIVTSFYALQASDDLPKALEEMVRVAKPKATILVLAKHPMRNLLEGWKNNNKLNYYEKGNVTSYILDKTITLNEPSHTMMEYLNPSLVSKVELQHFEERSDFPASEQIVSNLIYPTYLIMKLIKK